MSADYGHYSDTVLYDVFYETGTQLGGYLVAAEREAEKRGANARAEESLRRVRSS